MNCQRCVNVADVKDGFILCSSLVGSFLICGGVEEGDTDGVGTCFGRGCRASRCGTWHVTFAVSTGCSSIDWVRGAADWADGLGLNRVGCLVRRSEYCQDPLRILPQTYFLVKLNFRKFAKQPLS